MENNLDKKARARERVEELKGFYGHLMAYLGVNTMITSVKIVSNLSDGETFGEAFFDFGTFAIWLFWGIGLFFHGVKVFNFNPFFGKEWEKRQIQKYMADEKKEVEKYKRLEN
jgi:hypothetical protein